MAALAERGVETVRVQSSYRALAELCHAGRGASPAIVLVHPESLPDAAAAWEAKARYAPGARCWMYGPAADPKLRAVVETDVAAWPGAPRPETVVTPQPTPPADSMRIGPRPPLPRPPAGPPKLKLTGEPLPVGPGAEEDPKDASKAPLLSAEELRMLLGDGEP